MPAAHPARDLLTRLAVPFTGEELFDALPDVAFFIKNERAEYLVVNRTLADRLGVRDKAELIGRTAEQAFPPPLGRAYREQDQHLLRSGLPVTNQLELHLYPSGQTGWCLTDKRPLRAADGRVVGLAGVSRDLHPPDESGDGYADVAAAVRFAAARLDQRLTADDLAAVAGLTARQLDRQVRRLFRLTTGQLLLKLRMDEAARLLQQEARSVLLVGLTCGYANPSAFTRQFRRTTGLTPAEYRRRFQSL